MVDRIKTFLAERSLARLLPFVVLLYGFAFLCSWWGDPLALSPVLDGRENLVWAQKIQAGTLPAEPFYRALLYPWLLAKMGWGLGISGAVAAGFGLLCHLLNAALVAAIAQRLWRRQAAAWLAGLAYACYPVSLWFAVQVLDMTFSITLFLLALYALLRGTGMRARRWLLLAGAAAGLAVVARPNFLPPVLLFPLLAAGRVLLAQRKLSVAVLAAGSWVGLPLLGLLLAQGGLNYQRSGEFRLLPWQGAYNLYAANREGANGKFYMQRVSFDVVSAGQNTTRMESEYLYRQAHPDGPPASVSEMNAYWRAQLVEQLAADPVGWLGLMGRKLTYLFNDWEQYNNLTYAYHKARFVSLRWNPLGWGVLLLGAGAALACARRSVDPGRVVALLLVGTAYGAGVLLFFASARFRLPLAPLLCAFLGGLAVLPWRSFSPRKWLLLCGWIGGGALLVYGNWFEARDTSTYVQDELLLANAAHRLAQDAVALVYAQAALQRDPSLVGAQRVQIASLFYLWSDVPPEQRELYWRRLGRALSSAPSSAADGLSTFIHGLYCWREGARDEAAQLWELAASGNDRSAQWSREAQSIAAGAIASGGDSPVAGWMLDSNL